MQIPQRKSQALRKQEQNIDNHLTAEAVEMLRGKLKHLETSRPKTVQELSEAREMGDLSENAAYQMAKSRLASIDHRIFEIKEKLKNAIIIEKGADEHGKIKIGTTVTVEVADNVKVKFNREAIAAVQSQA